MLSFRVIPRSISRYLKQSTQQMHTSIKALSAKDPQDSSSSSSSDSDGEDEKAKKELDIQAKTAQDDIPKDSHSHERLKKLLESIQNAASAKKLETSEKKTGNLMSNFEVAIKPRKERFKKTKQQPVKDIPYQDQLTNAAKNVAETLQGNSSKIQLELLSQVLGGKTSTTKEVGSNTTETDSPVPIELSSLLAGMKVYQSNEGNVLHDNSSKKGARDFNFKTAKKQMSLSQSILYAKSQRRPQRRASMNELNTHQSPLGIFNHLPKDELKDTSFIMPTWEALENRELKSATISSPRNVFEELIQWTEQGKLWKFPIDNEQGLEEEEKVHFSEHVFLERHLKNWCPRKGPIRHFMELVCVGLSKNSYMTVEEKIGHITWYRNYFESKKDLLQELEIFEDTSNVSSQEEKQIES